MSRHFLAVVLATLPLSTTAFFNGLASVSSGLGRKTGAVYEGRSFSDTTRVTPPRPTFLAGYSRSFVPFQEGLKVIIENVDNNDRTGGRFGGGEMYGSPYAGWLSLGGYILKGLYGEALPLGLGGGNLHRYHDDRKKELKATIEYQLNSNVLLPVNVVLVFFEVGPADPDNEHPLGPILLEPPETQNTHLPGYGGALFGGLGAGGNLYLETEPDLGVIASLTLRPGQNSFVIQGLGPFKDLAHLAGRGAALCSEMVTKSGGQRFCGGEMFSVLRTVKLGYAFKKKPLF